MRQPVPGAEKVYLHGGSRSRQGRVRESALWGHLRVVGSLPPGTRWVVVVDRGADIYEHLQLCQAQGLGFVVRAAQNRTLVAGSAKTPAGRLFEQARAQPSTGTFSLALRRRPRHPTRAVVLQGEFLAGPGPVGSATAGRGD